MPVEGGAGAALAFPGDDDRGIVGVHHGHHHDAYEWNGVSGVELERFHDDGHAFSRSGAVAFQRRNLRGLLVDSPANFDARDDVRFHGGDALMDSNWGHAIRFVMEQNSRPTLEEHNAFRRSHFDPDLGDVGSAAQQEIETIYRISYWMPYGPTLPSGLDLFFFDTAAADGVPSAVKALQRALNVDPDGHIGIVTTEALITSIRTRKVSEVLDRYATERVSLKSTPTRINAALAAAKELIRY